MFLLSVNLPSCFSFPLADLRCDCVVNFSNVVFGLLGHAIHCCNGHVDTCLSLSSMSIANCSPFVWMLYCLSALLVVSCLPYCVMRCSFGTPVSCKDTSNLILRSLIRTQVPHEKIQPGQDTTCNEHATQCLKRLHNKTTMCSSPPLSRTCALRKKKTETYSRRKPHILMILAASPLQLVCTCAIWRFGMSLGRGSGFWARWLTSLAHVMLASSCDVVFCCCLVQHMAVCNLLGRWLVKRGVLAVGDERPPSATLTRASLRRCC